MAKSKKNNNSGFWLEFLAFLFILIVIIGIAEAVIESTTRAEHVCFALFVVFALIIFLTIKKGLLKKLTLPKKKINKQTSVQRTSQNNLSNNLPDLQSQLSAIRTKPPVNLYSSNLDVVLADIDKMSSSGLKFEEFTVQLLLDNGFKNVKKTQGSGDYGIDVLASKEGITYAIQCKCYSDKVGNKAVQEAYSGKNFYNCMVAVVLTNNFFTNAAIETAKANNVLLWDREKLIDFLKPYIKNERARQVTHLLSFMTLSVIQTLKSHDVESKVVDIFLSYDNTLIILEVKKEKEIRSVSDYLEEIASYIPSTCVRIKDAEYPRFTLSIENPTELKTLLK